MGIRQQLTELSNRPEGNTFEVWEEADGSIQTYMNGSTVVVAETNPLTGGITWSASDFAAITPEPGKFYLVEA